MSDVAPATSGSDVGAAPRPLRLLGGDAVVCEGDSCLILPEESAQS